MSILIENYHSGLSENKLLYLLRRWLRSDRVWKQTLTVVVKDSMPVNCSPTAVQLDRWLLGPDINPLCQLI